MNIVSAIFPSLFGETAAQSANFIGGTVIKSPLNEECVIIKADNGKPVEWFIDYLIAKGHDTTIVDKLKWKYNACGSLSIFPNSI